MEQLVSEACLCSNNVFKGEKKTLNLDICIFTQGLWFMVLDNTTSPDYKLCVKTMYQARDKEIVEVLWCSTFWQSFHGKTCCHLMYTFIVYVCKLWLKNHWVTLHPWVCHLKCSLCLLALPKESLGYTAPMSVPPKVQPMFVSSAYRITGLHCTHECAT